MPILISNVTAAIGKRSDDSPDKIRVSVRHSVASHNGEGYTYIEFSAELPSGDYYIEAKPPQPLISC